MSFPPLPASVVDLKFLQVCSELAQEHQIQNHFKSKTTSNPKPLQIQNHTRMGKFASVPMIAKFARECAARTRELRNRDTGALKSCRVGATIGRIDALFGG